ncbi:hypothetical protein [Microbacterium sp. SL75]|uniref:hypothetical protein n=1 Tax=Microbacterium sp. SL75 TaxID=2995140 RepID=UPI00226D8B2D|nr:hypothetical protein [Microbacterium sp. SL75]WAC69278.1 hypothetical protein OVA17_00840 [Microbacterium sp. SL75]
MDTSASRPADRASPAEDPRGADLPNPGVDEVSVREYLVAGGRQGLTVEEMFPT